MAHCTNCQGKWKRRTVWALAFTKEGKPCPHCGTIHHVAFKDKGVLLWLGFLFEIVAILFIILFPFLVKLSTKKTDY